MAHMMAKNAVVQHPKNCAQARRRTQHNAKICQWPHSYIGNVGMTVVAAKVVEDIGMAEEIYHFPKISERQREDKLIPELPHQLQ